MTEHPWLTGPPPERGVSPEASPDDPYTTVYEANNPQWWQQFADDNWFVPVGEHQPHTDQDVPLAIAVRPGRRDGEVTLTGVMVVVPDGYELTTRAMRQALSGPALLEALGAKWEKDAGMLTRRARPTQPVRPGRRKWDPDFEKVAAAYQANLRAHPRKPMQMTARDLHVSEATARRWVNKARELGHVEGTGR